MSSKFKRKKLWVDPKVQGALLVRVLAYWVSCLLTVALLGRVTTGVAKIFPGMDDQTWLPYMPAILASAFFLPLVVQDTLRVSNRFVGPMFRLRRSVRQLAAGEKVKKVYFRDGDMWQEFADEFNALLDRLEMEKKDEDWGASTAQHSLTAEEELLQSSNELLEMAAEMAEAESRAFQAAFPSVSRDSATV